MSLTARRTLTQEQSDVSALKKITWHEPARLWHGPWLLYSASVLGVAPMTSCVLLLASFIPESVFSRVLHFHSFLFTCTLWIIFMEESLITFVTFLVLFWNELCWGGDVRDGHMFGGARTKVHCGVIVIVLMAIRKLGSDFFFW